MKKIDYTNRIFGLLTVKEYDHVQGKWKCECECGTIVYYTSKQLRQNKPKSCGCLRSQNLVGRKFGRLIVKERTTERDDNYNVYYLCECDCGKTKLVTATLLLKGWVRSCGCLPEELNKKKGQELGKKTKEICIENTNIRNLTMQTPKNNTSGIKGVTWDASRGKWMAQISFQKKNYHLGRFDTKEEAAAIRKIAEEKLFGEFLKWYDEEYKKNIAE